VCVCVCVCVCVSVWRLLVNRRVHLSSRQRHLSSLPLSCIVLYFSHCTHCTHCTHTHTHTLSLSLIALIALSLALFLPSLSLSLSVSLCLFALSLTLTLFASSCVHLCGVKAVEQYLSLRQTLQEQRSLPVRSDEDFQQYYDALADGLAEGVRSGAFLEQAHVGVLWELSE
jgi:hypothetical protein